MFIQIYLNKDLFQYDRNQNTSGCDDNAAFGDLVSAAVANFAVKSKALPGLLNTFFANFLPAFVEIFPKFSKKTT